VGASPSVEERIPEERIPIGGEPDIVVARQRARELAKGLGFGIVDQSRVATAVSELTRNVVRYAAEGRGEVLIRGLAASRGTGIEVVVSDEGPGIPDLAHAMGEGVTAGRGMGMGLPGARRLMDEMEVDSALGRGTIVTIRTFDFDLGRDWILLIHTDGVSARFHLETSLVQELAVEPRSLAEVVLRDWGRPSDDATVVVACPAERVRPPGP
jgi:serine/threonine-protein kinase RsbT